MRPSARCKGVKGADDQGESKVLGRLHGPILFPGPCFFLSCPIGIEDFRTWFIDLWNNSIIPYLQEGAKDGIKVSPPSTPLSPDTRLAHLTERKQG